MLRQVNNNALEIYCNKQTNKHCTWKNSVRRADLHNAEIAGHQYRRRHTPPMTSSPWISFHTAGSRAALGHSDESGAAKSWSSRQSCWKWCLHLCWRSSACERVVCFFGYGVESVYIPPSPSWLGSSCWTETAAVQVLGCIGTNHRRRPAPGQVCTRPCRTLPRLPQCVAGNKSCGSSWDEPPLQLFLKC